MKRLLLTPVLLLLCTIAVAEVAPSEKQALVDLYVATNGENWVRTWDINTPVATWQGVTVTNDHVTGISLLFNGMTGQIPASIGNLPKLKKLELSFNQLTGTIPQEIGNLTKLQIVAFNGNMLTGTIPASIGNLVDLKELHLSSNKLSGVIPTTLGNAKAIEVLNVFDNNLSGSIPAELAFSKNLKQLIVAENNIEQTEGFASVLLFNKENENQFKKPSITLPAKSVIAIETSDDEN